jgi:hypothetical protein
MVKKNFSMDVPRYMLELKDETFTEFAFKIYPLAYLDGGIAHLPVIDLYSIMTHPSYRSGAAGAHTSRS